MKLMGLKSGVVGVAGALSATCAISTLADGQTLSIEDYFPLTPGFSWCADLWSSELCTGDVEPVISTGRGVRRVDSCGVPIHGILACDMQSWEADASCTPLLRGSGSLQSLDDQWLRVHLDYGFDNLAFEEYPGGIGVLPATFQVGQAYQDTSPWFGEWGDGSPWTGTQTNTFLASVFETITVPAGTFDALRVEVTSTACKISSAPGSFTSYSTATIRAWLAAGIGLIRLEELWYSEYTWNGSGPGALCDWPATPDDVCEEANTAELVSYDTCPWDCDGGESTDGTVGIVDFLALLAQWGGPGSCDFDGGGVGITDFLELLGHWGACP